MSSGRAASREVLREPFLPSDEGERVLRKRKLICEADASSSRESAIRFMGRKRPFSERLH